MSQEIWELVWQDKRGEYILVCIQERYFDDSGEDPEPIKVRKRYLLGAEREQSFNLDAFQQLILAAGDQLDLELPRLNKLLRDRKRQRRLRKDPLQALIYKPLERE